MEKILPIFEGLGAENLLQSVSEGLPQNNNEAINHLVWDISPKEKFAGCETVLMTYALAIFSL